MGSLALVVGLVAPTVVTVTTVDVAPAGAAVTQTFAPKDDHPTGASPSSVAVADLDEDGRPDLVTANPSQNTVSVLLGTSSGSLGAKTDYPTGVDPTAVAIGDLNEDGNLDVVTAQYNSRSISVLSGAGDGTLGSPMTHYATSKMSALAIGDVNEDGHLDVVTNGSMDFGAGWAGVVSVFSGTGTGALQGGGGSGGVTTIYDDIVLADFNGDGHLDQASTLQGSGFNGVEIRYGSGSGSLSTYGWTGSVASPTDLGVGDFNGDGRTDLVATSASGTISVLLKTASSYAPLTTYAAGGPANALATADIDADGALDLVVADTTASSVTVITGTGAGAFSQSTQASVGQGPTSVATGDLDQDGRRDIVTANGGGSSASVLRNTTNRKPLASGSSVTVQHGAATSITLTGSDPDSDPLTYTVTTPPSKGTLDCTGAPACTYTSNPGQVGADSFTFTVSDGSATSVPSTVSIDITNQTPVVATRSMQAAWRIDAPIGLGGMDGDGDALTFEVVGQPSKGTVDCTAAGACTYVAEVGATGTDTFTYRASDGVAWSAPATVTVTILDATARRAASAIDGGLGHACAVAPDGSVWCWGADDSGQLGNGGGASPTQSPVKVSNIDSAVAVTTMNNASCALTADGEVWCWGRNNNGQLGVGTSPAAAFSPVEVTSLSNVRALSGGPAHACAVTSDGTVSCWGNMASGLPGAGIVATPVEVAGLGGVVSIAAGNGYACAVTSAGEAWCWGSDDTGQLGDGGGFASSATPVKVSNLAGVSSIAAGIGHACALADGSVWCWGDDAFGQLGDGGSSLGSDVPVEASGVVEATAVTAAANATCAIDGSGQAWCWGDGSSGRLGNGAIANSQAPVQVSGLTDAVSVAAGFYSSCALDASGAGHCWGSDDTGQLGDGGSSTDSSVPVAVDGSHAFRIDETPEALALEADAPRRVATGLALEGFSPTASALSFAVTTEPGKGDLTCDGGGACTYTSGAGETGTDTFAFTATDVVGTSAPTTATISLTNTAPTAAPQAVGAPRRVPTEITLSGSDPNGDDLTYEVVDEPAAGVLECDGPDCTYTSNPGPTGSDSFTFRVSDGTTNSAPATVTISLDNSAPVADAQAVSAPRRVPTGIQLAGSDPNGDLLTYAVATQPTKGTVSCATDGLCLYTSAAGQTGIDTFTFRTNDGTTNSAEATVTVTLTNTAPTADSVGVLSFGPKTDHPTGDNPLSVAVGDVNGDGNKDMAVANIFDNSVSVLLGSATGTFGSKTDVATGTNPRAVSLGDVNGDGNLDLVTANSGSNSVSVLLGSATGTFGAKTDFPAGAYPHALALGDVDRDGNLDAVVANYNGNSVSVLLGSGTGTLGSKTDFAVTAGPRALALGDLDADGKLDLVVANSDGSTVSVRLGTATGLFGPKTEVSTGSRPHAVALGDLNGDTKLDLTVANYGSNSIATLLGSGTGTFGAPVDVAAGSGPLAVALGDVNGDAKLDAFVANYNANSVSVLLGSGKGTFGPKSDVATGSGPLAVALARMDGDQKLDLAFVSAVSDSVSVLLNTSTAAPIDAAVNVAKTFQLSAADANSDHLSYSVVTPASKGTLSCDASGSCDYRSNAGTSGMDTFTFKVHDGTVDSAPATVVISLSNTVPAANDQAVSAPRRVATGIQLTSSDANGDARTYRVATQPTKGTLSSCTSAGACVYTSHEGETGTDSFTFVANDGAVDSPPATVTVTLTNTAPVAANQSVVAPRGVDTLVVLGALDANLDPLTYRVVDDPTKGEVVCNGSFGEACTYTAGPGQTGSDSFTFVADDGTEDSAPKTVSVTITNQKPVADAITAAAPRGVATEIVLTGSDPNSDPYTFTKLTNPTKGLVACEPTGICTYTAAAGTSGTDSFTYRTSDGALASSTATVTIDITNQAPVADARTLDAGRGVGTPVVLSGSDPNGDALTFEVVDSPTKGLLVCDPLDTSACTYTSGTVERGIDSFTYRASDGTLASDPVTVEITLVNAGPTANDQSVDVPRGVATPIVVSGADPEGDDVTYTVVDEPTKGDVVCSGANGSECTYTADAGSTGEDTFTFTVADGTDVSAPATVTITITNQAPVGGAQTVTGNAPTTETPITLSAVDANSDPLTYAVSGQPTKGTVSCTVAGACAYVADPGSTGTDSFRFTADDGFGGTSAATTITLQLDATTPGVFVGKADKMEPESGNASGRGTAIPLTLTRPSPVPLTIWYHTVDDTATGDAKLGDADYTRFGTASQPRAITIPAGATWTTIAPTISDDDDVEGDETFTVHITAVTGGAAYLVPATTEVTIRDADSVTRSDPALPLLTVTDITQYEGNATSPTARKAQVRIELSKPVTTKLTMRYSTLAGTAVAGSDYTAKTNALITFAPGQTEQTIDLGIIADNLTEAELEAFTVRLSSIAGGNVHVVDDTATVTLIDEDQTRPACPTLASGTWLGEADYWPVTADLTVSGTTVSGHVQAGSVEGPVENGTIDCAAVRFTLDGQWFDGTLSADGSTLTGTWGSYDIIVHRP